MMSKVNIKVEEENREELKQRGVSGDTLDDVIEKLMKRSDLLDQIIDISEEAGELTV